MADSRSPRSASDAELRADAQRRVTGTPAAQPGSHDELLHELRVHQIELEMQNEALRQTQIDLEESRDRYRELFELGPAAYLIVGEDDRVLSGNRAAGQLLQCASGDLIGRRFSTFVAWKDQGGWKEFLERLIPGHPHTCELEVKRDDGSQFAAQLQCLRINGSAPKFWISVLDISTHVQARRLLVDAARAKDEFLATLAHELRAPLAPIRTAAQILADIQSDDDTLRWTQDIIERQVTHLARLLDDLVDVSRVARGIVALRTARVGLQSIINQAVETTTPLIRAKGQTLRLDQNIPDIEIDADASRLAQVLINLLDNACKYTHEGGNISVSVGRARDALRIVVSDDGMGISAELLPHVFEMFRQGEHGLDRRQGGLGIGLTLARRLVELHGGTLVACSEGEGRGAQFILTVPAFANAPPAPPQRVAPGLARARAFNRIMLVDDDKMVLATMSVLLANRGYQVKCAGNGRVAIELAADFRPDLVLLDIGLPGMNGFDIARELRKLAADVAPSCLVAVSGYGDDNTRARAIEAGFDAHFTKPVDIDTVLAKLAEARSTPG